MTSLSESEFKKRSKELSQRAGDRSPVGCDEIRRACVLGRPDGGVSRGGHLPVHFLGSKSWHRPEMIQGEKIMKKIPLIILTLLLCFFVSTSCSMRKPLQADHPFVEEVPAWRMPDLMVINLTVTPERANPGDMVTLGATVSNIGEGNARPANLIFFVDGSEIHRVSVDPLVPNATVEISTNWVASGPGGSHDAVFHCILELYRFIYQHLDILRYSGLSLSPSRRIN